VHVRGGSSVLAVAIVLMAAPMAAAAQETVVAPAPVGTITRAAVRAQTPSEGVRPRHAKGDPLEGFNRKMFSLNQVFDRVFFRPVAMVYKTVVPNFARKGIRHFFSNIGEPLVFANDMLQLKPKRAVKTLGRFVVNSTVGVGGLLDVAKTKDFRLPHRDNSLGDTLGHYGIGPGPYLFLPFLGPSTFRDLPAGVAEAQALPVVVGSPFDRAEFRIPQTVLTGLDLRVESDAPLKALTASAIDPYATLRSSYLQDRAGRVAATHGARGAGAISDPLTDPLADPLADPAGGSAAVAPAAPASANDPLADPLTDPAAEGAVGTATSKPERTAEDSLSDPLADPAASASPK
jgi:phospholipid-binding lipoprotein MlaA